MTAHEIMCDFNPNNKTCFSCRNYDSNGYTEDCYVDCQDEEEVARIVNKHVHAEESHCQLWEKEK